MKAERYAGTKRPTNLSVRGDLIGAARAARVNLSALLERALSEELVRLKWRQWRDENQPALAKIVYARTSVIAGVSQTEFGAQTGSVAAHARAITGALDLLLWGF